MKTSRLASIISRTGLFSVLCLAHSIVTANPSGWEILGDRQAAQSLSGNRWMQPKEFLLARTDPAAIHGKLATSGPQVIEVPSPSGELVQFRVSTYSMMEAPLAASHPDIVTFRGTRLDNPRTSIYGDITPQGFHASVLGPNESWYVDPYLRTSNKYYVSYLRQKTNSQNPWACGVSDSAPIKLSMGTHGNNPTGTQLRTYRLACAATGEFTTFHGGTAQLGLAAIVTGMNRVNQIWERDLAIVFTLVANNDQLVYTDGATDPYTNGDSLAQLNENQANIDTVIGTANYDVGHVFGTGSGGVAILGCVCDENSKAKGQTSLPNPIGDPFFVDYVAHELGHQFGARHTFSSNSQGSCSPSSVSGSTAVEPGGGTTIMAYAGICADDNIQLQSDPFFHAVSLDEMQARVAQASCGAQTPTGNTPPTVNAGTNYAIPRLTPFTLVGSATDSDGDTLTYNWQQMDAAIIGPIGTPDNGTGPLFRFYPAETTGERTFPKLATILSNVSDPAEKLPAVARNGMKFRLTVRDNRAGGGATNSNEIQLQIVGTAGPFRVTSPNSPGTFTGSTNITWDVAGTDAAPISVSEVSVRLSTDGGLTFPTVLAANTPNDGSETLVLPSVNSTTARIKIAAVGNVFFDVSDGNFTVSDGEPSTVNWVQAINNDFASGSAGWSPLGQSGPLFTSEIGLREYDSANTALMAVVAPSPRGRIIGWVEDAAADLPYSQIGSGNFVRAKFSMFYSGPGDPASDTLFNKVPNFRLNLRTRGVVTSQLEVNHNAQTAGSPAQAFVTRELGPSTNPATPSLYRVDFDPIDTPFWTGSATEGVQRGFETLVSGSDFSFVEGTLALTDSSIGTYPALSDAVSPTKSFVPGAAGTSDFDNPSIVATRLGYSVSELFRYVAGPDPADYFNPTILSFTINSEAGVTVGGSTQGITINSTALPTNRVAVADAALNGGVFGETNTTRLRIEPGRLYRASFRLKHNGASNTAPYTRFNARTVGFGWNSTLELLGARGLPVGDGRTALAQVLPGTGNQVPGSTADGTVYNLLFSTPLSPEIRADVAGSLTEKFPNLSTQPGPGDPATGAGNPAAGSLRNVNFGFTVVDSLSIVSTTDTDSAEAANDLQLNRIDVRVYPQVVD